MCLYPKKIINRKYTPTKKNNFNAPKCEDKRVLYVNADCGKCIECRKKKQRQWIIRLCEEIKNTKGIFVTLTFNNTNLNYLKMKVGTNPNLIATKALRLFLERIRKKTGKSIKHWCITELGEEKGRIHLHGIFFCEKKIIEENWKYGNIFIGQFVNEKTVFYITKYMLKVNTQKKDFIGKVLCSAGIGKEYINSLNANNNKYVPHETNETYRTKTGRKIFLPAYYRNKIYNDEEREKLWIEKIEKGISWIMGEKCKDNSEEKENLIKYYKEYSKRLYGDNPEKWEKMKKARQNRKLREYKKKNTNNA